MEKTENHKSGSKLERIRAHNAAVEINLRGYVVPPKEELPNLQKALEGAGFTILAIGRSNIIRPVDSPHLWTIQVCV